MYLSKPWTDIEETYSPIDISLAREIMMNINNQTFSKESNGWIFILCSEKTENNIGEIMLASCISAKENNRKIISYNVSSLPINNIKKGFNFLISFRASSSTVRKLWIIY